MQKAWLEPEICKKIAGIELCLSLPVQLSKCRVGVVEVTWDKC